MVKHVLITAGPTIEKIDEVRFISNFSSGKMGVSIANKAASLGANVILILGPSHQKVFHNNINVINVVSADDMLCEVLKYKDEFDIGIFSAAVSDFKPRNLSLKKIKKSDDFKEIKLALNKDILYEISKEKKSNQYLVGFALETNNEIDNSIKKLENKKLDLIVLNSLNDENAGFNYDTNKVTIIDKQKNIFKYDLKSKDDVANDLFTKILNDIK